MVEVARSYNGWSPTIRNVRGRHCPWPKRGTPCEVCGNDLAVGYHAEEYGSTLECYLAHLHPLCPRCHAMLHLRFRIPNRWRAFLADRATVPVCRSLGEAFSIVPKSDVGPVEPVKTGIPWVDGLSLERYSGLPKIATRNLRGRERPDPECYPPGWKRLEGLVVDPDGATRPVLFVERQAP